MKTMKKVLALLLAAVMVLAMGVTVFAEQTTPTKGSIRISNPDEDQIYTAYKIFDAVPYGGGNDTEKATASTSGKVVYYATDVQKDFWENPENGGDDLLVFTDAGTNGYNVSLQANVGAQQIAEYFNAHFKELVNHTDVFSVVPSDDEASWSNLDFGYYFITSNTGSVVSIDTTNYNVVIEDKNNYSDPFDPGEGDNPDGKLKDVFAVNYNSA